MNEETVTTAALIGICVDLMLCGLMVPAYFRLVVPVCRRRLVLGTDTPVETWLDAADQEHARGFGFVPLLFRRSADHEIVFRERMLVWGVIAPAFVWGRIEEAGEALTIVAGPRWLVPLGWLAAGPLAWGEPVLFALVLLAGVILMTTLIWARVNMLETALRTAARGGVPEHGGPAA